MSSTNEELPPPPKPRASPLDFRNTDLVSRLLAATPPYLYNMPLVPNSYFFSEMLRSFVQAKAEGQNRNQPAMHHRRSRKRSWAQTRTEYYQKEAQNLEKIEVPPWAKDGRKPIDLVTEKPSTNQHDVKGEPDHLPKLENSSYPLEKQMGAPNNQMYPPSVPPNFTPDSHSSNMILPPPPPIWYPPLYPTPYGIDPLHFFIDLRVSGHIYDRKTPKDPSSAMGVGSPSGQPPNETQTSQDTVSTEEKDHPMEPRDIFKQSRHSSAFSVPTPSPSKNLPINLSSDTSKDCKVKFDVKSLGFDRSKTSINYIMSNLTTIYRKLQDESCKEPPCEQNTDEKEIEETEEQKQKRVKDLRALIGLELVVDYMNHAKPGQQSNQNTSEESSTDFESSGSPALEVVALNEENTQEL